MLSRAGRNRRTVNYLKAVYFGTPEWTPAVVYFLPSAWIAHRERLEELVLSHPRVFPDFRKGSVDFDFKAGFSNPLYELGRHAVDAVLRLDGASRAPEEVGVGDGLDALRVGDLDVRPVQSVGAVGI